MYTTAVLQSKSIQTFLLPLVTPPTPPHFPSVSLMSRTVRQASSAFCSFKEELGGGQGATSGKVTDERAVEEGGGEVALKRVEGSGVFKIDHRG